IPSLIGIFLFMTPVKVDGDFTIPIAVLAGFVESGLTNYLSLIMMLIIVITGICTVLFKINLTGIQGKPFLQRLFLVGNFWMLICVIAAIIYFIVYIQLGTEAISGEYTGLLLLDDLLLVLFSVFLFAVFFLPLLTNFGLLEFLGSF